ncbi:TonB-dependent receptor [Rhodocytophaga rosea]|uniref:TonB-dependent receptor n=2 Tax=Rhodocytophaga rosea TaxID=2704465 RepID=A0A6C0GXL0_9BACT|nr:TonB-dependent receptor [Rhodocytophaga rosea]
MSEGLRTLPWRTLLTSFSILILTGFVSVQTFAQGRTVNGKVTAQEDNSPLPGVNITVKGTTTGTVTDASGSYSLSAPDNSTLVFSFIGYTTQEVAVGTRSNIDVALLPDVKALQEVVVTGYTVQEKKDLTSAVAVIKPKELLSVAATSVEQQLQGRAAGVTVTNSNVPGQGANVRIRGFGTLGNNDPLYIIDGVPTKDNLANFNQNDIESIQILKDATSASIYGARAGNGVVIITTKKGKNGEPRVTFDAYYGVQQPRKLLDLLNTAEYGDYLWQSKKNAGVVNSTTGNPEQGQYGNGPNPIIPDYIVPSGAFEGDPRVNPANYSINRFDQAGNNIPAFGSTVFQITKANKVGTKWLEEIFDPAPQQNYQLGVSGGTDKSSYAFSVGHFNQQSMLKYNGFKRYTLRANTSFTIKNRIRLGENLQVLYAQRRGTYGNQSEGNEVSMAYRMQPIVPVYDIAGNFAGTLGNNLGNAASPVALLSRAKENGYQDVRIFGNTFAEVDLIKGLTARTSFGVDATIGRGRYAGAPSPEVSEPGRFYSYTADVNYRYTWTWTNTLNYKLAIGDIHEVNVNIGTEAIRGYGEFQSGFRDRYIVTGSNVIPTDFRYLDAGNPLFQNVGGYNNSNFSLFSYFGQLNYSLMDKYLFQAILRRDASSRFLQATRYATFPAFSVGWRISEESFMDAVPVISDLKLRAGWGQTGNQDGISDVNAYQTFTNSIYDFGYSLSGNPNGYDLAFGRNKFPNPQGKWEATTSTNLGFDLGLLENKVEVNFDWYNRLTEDILLPLQLPLALGLGEYPSFNVASVRNRGVDLGINFNDRFMNNELTVNAGLIFSTYRNEVTVIDPENDGAFITGPGLRTPPVTRSQKGQPISSYYGYIVDGIFQTPEEAAAAPSFPGYNDASVYIDGQVQKGVGKFKYRDVNGDGQITSDDQTFIGNPHPDFTYGLNLSLGYKGFELTGFLQGVQGNELFNYVKYWTDFNTFQGNRSTRVLTDSWRPGKTDAKLPILDENDALSSRPSTYFVEDGSYLRLKNIQLAYALPADLVSRFGLSQVRIYVQGQNLLTATKYQGLDPELSLRDNNNQQIGVDEGVFPTPKVYMFGLNIGF